MGKDTLLKQLGERIRKTRLRNRISQQQLGLACGISADYISKIERGKTNPTIKILNSIAKGLQTRLGDLIVLSDQNEKR